MQFRARPVTSAARPDAERPGTGGDRCLAAGRLSQRCPSDTRVYRDQRSQATYGSRSTCGDLTGPSPGEPGSYPVPQPTRSDRPGEPERSPHGGPRSVGASPIREPTGPSLHAGSRLRVTRSHRLSLHPFPWLARIRRHSRSRSSGSNNPSAFRIPYPEPKPLQGCCGAGDAWAGRSRLTHHLRRPLEALRRSRAAGRDPPFGRSPAVLLAVCCLGLGEH